MVGLAVTRDKNLKLKISAMRGNRDYHSASVNTRFQGRLMVNVKFQPED